MPHREHLFQTVIIYAQSHCQLARQDLALAARVVGGQHCVIILLCGAAGTGKSTLASLLAQQLGLTNVLSTDSLRHIMRCALLIAECAECALICSSVCPMRAAVRTMLLDRCSDKRWHSSVLLRVSHALSRFAKCALASLLAGASAALTRSRCCTAAPTRQATPCLHSSLACASSQAASLSSAATRHRLISCCASCDLFSLTGSATGAAAL